MSARYIDVDKLIENAKDKDLAFVALSSIRQFPTEDVEPVRHGSWKLITDSVTFDSGTVLRYDEVVCSVCGQGDDESGYTNYCPHCGAKMDLPSEDLRED